MHDGKKLSIDDYFSLKKESLKMREKLIEKNLLTQKKVERIVRGIDENLDVILYNYLVSNILISDDEEFFQNYLKNPIDVKSLAKIYNIDVIYIVARIDEFMNYKEELLELYGYDIFETSATRSVSERNNLKENVVKFQKNITYKEILKIFKESRRSFVKYHELELQLMKSEANALKKTVKYEKIL